MIGKVSGTIDSIYDDHLILDVRDIGYRIFCSAKTLSTVVADNSRYSFFIETYVREDSIKLYGFLSLDEKEWFGILQNVQGVGAKVSLAILGVFSPAELSQIIINRDITSLCRVSGIGKKVAERIITELKNRKIAVSQDLATIPNMKDDSAAEAISALENLGYMKQAAQQAVTLAQKKAEVDLTTAQLIRLALKELSPKG